MNRNRRQSEHAALRRDLVWALLWGLRDRGWPNEGWATSRAVYRVWLDGRDECGIAFAPDYIGQTPQISADLKRLVAEGRAERRKLPGRHPTYRTLTALAGRTLRDAPRFAPTDTEF